MKQNLMAAAIHPFVTVSERVDYFEILSQRVRCQAGEQLEALTGVAYIHILQERCINQLNPNA